MTRLGPLVEAAIHDACPLEVRVTLTDGIIFTVPSVECYTFDPDYLTLTVAGHQPVFSTPDGTGDNVFRYPADSVAAVEARRRR